MPDQREPYSVLDAAEKAAASGDFASAEQLLRRRPRCRRPASARSILILRTR